MTEALARQGWGAHVPYTVGQVGLGQFQEKEPLRTVTSHQLSVSQRGPLTLVADARLDNRAELIDALGWTDRPSTSISDRRLLLGAYDRWGERCPKHLVGAFAFAIWDGRERRLVCARDHLGLKPFYYFRSSELFAFASEIKALLALPQVPRRINDVRVADYLMMVAEDKEITFYQDILRLPPAHTLTVSAEDIRLNKYWSLDPNRELDLGSDEAYAERYRELFADAVRARLRGTDSVGTFLSGGLDSSSVTCMAHALAGPSESDPLHTFSLVFDEVPQSDERPYIEVLAGRDGIRPHFVRGDQLNPLDNLDQMLECLDEPFFTPNLFLHWGLLKAVGLQDVDVVLDGLLGDSVISHGTRYVTELAATGQWVQMAREIQAAARHQDRPGRAAWRVFRRFVLSPLVFEPLRRNRHTFRGGLPAHLGPHFINSDFARQVHWNRRAQKIGHALPRTPLRAREEHYEELASGMLPGALEIARKAARAFGIDVRFPFADRRLMEYCLAVPPRQKCQDGWTRVIARRGLAGVLPEKIRTRYGKANLHPNFVRSLLTIGRDQLSPLIFDELPMAADYVDVSAVQQVYRKLLRSEASDQVLQPIWLAAILARWLSMRDRFSASGGEAQAGPLIHNRSGYSESAVA